MNTINQNSLIARNQEVVFTQIDEDLVVIGPNDELFYGVNATGTFIWSMLEKTPLPIDLICERIKQQYEVTDETCFTDITTFVQSMVAQNILHVVD